MDIHLSEICISLTSNFISNLLQFVVEFHCTRLSLHVKTITNHRQHRTKSKQTLDINHRSEKNNKQFANKRCYFSHNFDDGQLRNKKPMYGGVSTKCQGENKWLVATAAAVDMVPWVCVRVQQGNPMTDIPSWVYHLKYSYRQIGHFT